MLQINQMLTIQYTGKKKIFL